MSSPLKRSAPDDGHKSGLTGPFTTLYFYPPFSKADIVPEVFISIPHRLLSLTVTLVRQRLTHRAASRLETLLSKQLRCPSSTSPLDPHDVWQQNNPRR